MALKLMIRAIYILNDKICKQFMILPPAIKCLPLPPPPPPHPTTLIQ